METWKLCTVFNLTEVSLTAKSLHSTELWTIDGGCTESFHATEQVHIILPNAEFTLPLSTKEVGSEFYQGKYIVRVQDGDYDSWDFIVYEISPYGAVEVVNDSKSPIILWLYDVPHHKQVKVLPRSNTKVETPDETALHVFGVEHESDGKQRHVFLNWNRNSNAVIYQDSLKFTLKWEYPRYLLYVLDS